MENDVTITCNFDVCSKCKSICCIDAKPPLTINRKKILQEYLKKQGIYFEKPFAAKEYTYPSVDDKAYCGFFNKQTGKCIVHPVKPETCVAGPITFNINFFTRKIEWYLKTKELCAYAGVIFCDTKGFQSLFKESKKQIMELIRRLSAEELRSLMKIEEPQTFKFSEDNLPKEVEKKLDL